MARARTLIPAAVRSRIATAALGICLGNGEGTCSTPWIEALNDCFVEQIGHHVTIHDPSSGGYIARNHAAEMPCLQLEMSRAPFLSNLGSREMVLTALWRLVARIEKG